MSILEERPIETIKNVLDYLTVRGRVIASNVANVETPGYKTRDVSFESVLNARKGDLSVALVRTNERHMPKEQSGDGAIETFYAYESYGSARDGNNDVDVDKEMLKTGEIQANFSIFSELLKRKLQTLKSVISGNM